MKFRVIKDIPDGWEGPALVGDILKVGKWKGDLTLFRGKTAICDVDSLYAKEHCEEVLANDRAASENSRHTANAERDTPDASPSSGQGEETVGADCDDRIQGAEAAAD